ncbi:MAG: UDP-N-acetylmuramate dehydrogenase [candidate division Zixibacteria bacterium]|nr:UDP-N-acetylmuramate dehydrogenase [candidate division Zixibacteria bacterium]
MATTIIKSTFLTCKKEVYKKLFESLGDRLKQDVALASYTTFGIGGKADLFYPARKPEELVGAIRTAQKLRLRFFILGGGSNILVSDSGFKGLAVKNECQDILTNRDSIICQSGAFLSDVVNQACKLSLSGLEFATGIPGTVGGAIRGNAGAFGKSVSEVLTNAVILTEKGEIKEVETGHFRFAYRESRLKQTGDVLLSATFKLRKQDKEEIKKKIRSNLKERGKSLPLKEKSAGCFFKNVIASDRKISAGFLLDQIGAKGRHEGDAKVSAQHANILINARNAKAADVRRLARELKKRVREKFDIELEEEVVYIN